jgi:hypothetical protein
MNFRFKKTTLPEKTVFDEYQSETLGKRVLRVLIWRAYFANREFD